MSYCGNCGKSLGSGDNFCTSCGRRAGRGYSVDATCSCSKCGAAMTPPSSGRGDTYCGCEDQSGWDSSAPGCGPTGFDRMPGGRD